MEKDKKWPMWTVLLSSLLTKKTILNSFSYNAINNPLPHPVCLKRDNAFTWPVTTGGMCCDSVGVGQRNRCRSWFQTFLLWSTDFSLLFKMSLCATYHTKPETTSPEFSHDYFEIDWSLCPQADYTHLQQKVNHWITLGILPYRVQLKVNSNPWKAKQKWSSVLKFFRKRTHLDTQSNKLQVVVLFSAIEVTISLLRPEI